jgi:hypothetical protein
MADRQAGFWVIQVPGWLLLIYLLYAQAIPAFDYDLGVSMGTQESAKKITRVGAAFWYGFAFADLVVYIPLLAAGLIGHWMRARWAPLVMGSALGITLYWPMVCLAAVAKAEGAPGWNPGNTTQYWIVLPIIALWAAVGLWQLARAD